VNWYIRFNFTLSREAHRSVSKLQALVKQVETCRLCPLCRSRHQAVPGEGNENATVMLIGEGPGYHEDREGRPFIGPAGQFLDELLGLAGLRRSDVYITNVVKCRPPNNRDPLPVEIDACAPYLERQIAAINPKVIITLGRFSMAKFVNETSISRIHGQVWPQEGRVVVTMYHPAAGLHNDRLKDVIREDFRKLPGIMEQAQHAPTAAPPAPAVPPDDGLALLDAYAALVAVPEPAPAPVVVAEEVVSAAPPVPAPSLAAGDEEPVAPAVVEVVTRPEVPVAAEPAAAPLAAAPVISAEAPAPFEAAAPEAPARPRRGRKPATPVAPTAPEIQAAPVPASNGHVAAEEAEAVTTVPLMEIAAAGEAVIPAAEPAASEPVAALEPEPSPAPEPAAPGRKKGKAAPAAEQLSLF
jgi:DNA polymerase